MTPQYERNLEILNISKIYTKIGKTRFSAKKVVRTWNFQGIFGKIGEGMQSNLHTNLQAYVLSNVFVIGKIRFMEFYQLPSTEISDDSRTEGIPKFRFIFCFIGLVYITYNRLATFGWPKKLSRKNQRGSNSPPLIGRWFYKISLFCNSEHE